MTVTITDSISDETREDVQAALEPLLVDNGIDPNVVELHQLNVNMYGNVEVELMKRS